MRMVVAAGISASVASQASAVSAATEKRTESMRAANQPGPVRRRQYSNAQK